MPFAAPPTTFGATLPDWLIAELPTIPTVLPTREDRVRLVNALADRNWREGSGGPFAAIVVDHASGEVISVAVNIVLASGLSSMHAEVTALSLAQTALGSWDLGADRDLELVVNWRTCAMCFGAVIWSGIKHVLLSGTGPECEALTGFDEGPLAENWIDELASRGITVEQDVLRADAVAVFAAYGESDAVVYNARGTS